MELAIETGRWAVEAGLRTIFVTNGYMTPEVLALVTRVLHGTNVNLKSFSDRYYRKACGATLPPVLEPIACLGLLPHRQDDRRAATPATALHGAAQIGRDAKLRYVYTGNVPGDVWENRSPRAPAARSA
jgi:pyruvate formate lyase activating enzyme